MAVQRDVSTTPIVTDASKPRLQIHHRSAPSATNTPVRVRATVSARAVRLWRCFCKRNEHVHSPETTLGPYNRRRRWRRHEYTRIIRRLQPLGKYGTGSTCQPRMRLTICSTSRCAGACACVVGSRVTVPAPAERRAGAEILHQYILGCAAQTQSRHRLRKPISRVARPAAPRARGNATVPKTALTPPRPAQGITSYFISGASRPRVGSFLTLGFLNREPPLYCGKA